MATKIRIYPNDTLPVWIEARKTDPDYPDDSRGLPYEVVSATARVRDTLNDTYLELGGTGVTEVPATVTPPTGTTRNDKGSIVTFILESQFTAVPNDYVIFIQSEFTDGNKLTEDIRVKIQELR